jgi:hypothetical protein
VNELERWLAHMRRGEFEAAWDLSDRLLARRESSRQLPRHEQWVWDGTPLEGKRVLIRCYHGLGDTIQFIRYAPLVKEIAREVMVWAQPSVIPLLETARGVDRFLPLHDGAPDVEYDADVEIMELAHVFRRIVGDVPYLHVPPLATGGGIGVAWRSGDWDPNRDIPPELLTRLPGVTHNLQRGETRPELLNLPERNDPFGTARLMRGLDLVITVDTMTAHLAGALGVPVWTLLRADADWRWMEDRDDSPWYPTMRLFRQQEPGEWEPVIERVTAALTRPLPNAAPAES